MMQSSLVLFLFVLCLIYSTVNFSLPTSQLQCCVETGRLPSFWHIWNKLTWRKSELQQQQTLRCDNFVRKSLKVSDWPPADQWEGRTGSREPERRCHWPAAEQLTATSYDHFDITTDNCASVPTIGQCPPPGTGVSSPRGHTEYWVLYNMGEYSPENSIFPATGLPSHALFLATLYFAEKFTLFCFGYPPMVVLPRDHAGRYTWPVWRWRGIFTNTILLKVLSKQWGRVKLYGAMSCMTGDKS